MMNFENSESNINSSTLKSLDNFPICNYPIEHNWEEGFLKSGNTDLAVEEFKSFLDQKVLSSVKNAIVFLDVSFSSLASKNEVMGIITAPSTVIKPYKEVLQNLLNLDDNSTLGSHYVFNNGLPRYELNNGTKNIPKTQEDMKEMESSSDIKRVSSQYFEKYFPSDENVFNLKKIEELAMTVFSASDLFISLNSERNQREWSGENFQSSVSEASKKETEFCFNNFVKLLKQRSEELHSPTGSSLNYITAVPLGVWRKRPSSNRYFFLPTAQLFIGLSIVREDQGHEILKYLISCINAYVSEVLGSIRIESLKEEQIVSEYYHRLPDSLTMILNSFKRQKQNFPKLEIPNQVYHLICISAMVKRKLPIWSPYLDNPSDESSQSTFTVSKEKFTEIWEDMLPLAKFKLLSNPKVLKIFPSIKLSFGSGFDKLKSNAIVFFDQEAQSLIWALTIYLLEACQHSWKYLAKVLNDDNSQTFELDNIITVSVDIEPENIFYISNITECQSILSIDSNQYKEYEMISNIEGFSWKIEWENDLLPGSNTIRLWKVKLSLMKNF